MNSDFFERIIAQKSIIEGKMAKILFSSAATTFLLYLAGSGVDPASQFFGLRASEIPGILVVLSLISSFGLALSAYTFMNSQVYAALIDQIVLQITQDGLLDPDIYKSAFSEEWLIFKVIRRDFSFFVDQHIIMSWPGRTLNSTVFLLMILVTMAPFVVLVISQPYLTLTVLDNSWPSMLAKVFSVLCALSALGLVVIAQVAFKCSVELQDASVHKAKVDKTP